MMYTCTIYMYWCIAGTIHIMLLMIHGNNFGDRMATHGLSYKRSEGYHYQNDIIHRSSVSACVPSLLEPSSLPVSRMVMGLP